MHKESKYVDGSSSQVHKWYLNDPVFSAVQSD